MKIGLLTIHHVRNYGSKLQAYATCRVLESLGHSCRIINYEWPSALVAASRYNFKGYLLHLGNRWAKHLFGVNREFKRFDEQMDKFLPAHVAITSLLTEREQLKVLADEYDCFVSGSDQIWQPWGIEYDPTFLLDWVPDGTHKVAMASSLGVREVPERLRTIYTKYLKRYAAISVREESAVSLVQALTGKSPMQLLDPTLLLTAKEWSEITSDESQREPYILIYGGVALPANTMESVALEIQKQTGWDIIKLYGKAYHRFSRRVHHVFDAGPLEYLGLIKNASVVLANSFHGTVFSINFGVPFYSYMPAKGDFGIRQQSILRLLGLEARSAYPGQQLSELAPIKMDFTVAHQLLYQQRVKSINWLRENLQHVN